MKKLMCLMLFLLFFMGCASTTCLCPKEDIVIKFYDPMGIPFLGVVPKNHLNNKDNYFTLKKWNELRDKYKKGEDI